MASAARKKAKMYEKLVETLEEKISELVPKISKAETTLIAVHNTFTNGGGDAEGQFMLEFEEHELIWNKKYRNVISEMEMGVTSLQFKKAEAESLKQYWEMQAELEEMKENAGF